MFHVYGDRLFEVVEVRHGGYRDPTRKIGDILPALKKIKPQDSTGRKNFFLWAFKKNLIQDGTGK